MRFSPTLIAAAVAAAWTATPAVANGDIETIVVTGSRFEQNVDDQLMLIDSIDRVQIERIAPKSIADLLVTLPSVSVQSNGGAGQSTSIQIRGANSGHTLVIVDGVRLGSATLGQADLSSIAPEQVESIEVLRGPRASLWGSNAIGGVVQIFTRKLEQGEWYGSAEYGSNNYYRGSAGAGISHGDGSTSFSASYEESDGFDVKRDGENDDDGYDRLTVGINGEQHLDDQWKLNWVGQVTDGQKEFDGNPNMADFTNYHYLLGAEFDGEQLRSKLSVSQMKDDSQNSKDGDTTGASAYVTQRDTLSWIGEADFDALSLSTGFDWYKESVDGDYAKDSRNVFGLFSAVRYQAGKLITEGVVRVDEVSGVDSEVTYNLSAGYQLTDAWRLSAGHGTAFKTPSFNDLYFPGSGNENLQSETSSSTEVTLQFKQDNYSAFISGYHTEVDQLIEWAPTGEFDDNGWEIWKPANVANATLQGIEVGVAYYLGDFTSEFNYSYLDATDDSDGSQLDGRSEHSGNIVMSYQWDVIDTAFEYHYQGERQDGSDTVDAYHGVNVSVGYQFANNWQVRLKVNNLLDEELITNGDYYGPGAEYYISLSYLNF